MTDSNWTSLTLGDFQDFKGFRIKVARLVYKGLGLYPTISHLSDHPHLYIYIYASAQTWLNPSSGFSILEQEELDHHPRDKDKTSIKSSAVKLETADFFFFTFFLLKVT